MIRGELCGFTIPKMQIYKKSGKRDFFCFFWGDCAYPVSPIF